MNYKTCILEKGKQYETLEDILPKSGNLDILFIAKTPATISVNKGHYFQGKQGRMFWNKLADYHILNVPYGEYEDNYLLKNNYGITDIVKIPRDFGNEPSKEEYREGYLRILEIIERYKPKVIIFVYKKVLDEILSIKHGFKIKSDYGFNPQYDSDFNSKVFVFPMPGTPCTRETSELAMNELSKIIIKK
ncbi:uracil-DNA glycosylase family protein [Dysgonomonas sp. BGC7]|uniref:uracil-DNA glycosylase family protein n=1 Tax=Dysgonomonas sp. BGC7 TaxID=1658008 RepID=UPI0006813E63|nr:uracil-DNA glycosylase family protein [Dysgonomonas sp. BGC7]MBD8388848.1 hypothetical protein [Dysgonomonas sp. BGC7]